MSVRNYSYEPLLTSNKVYKLLKVNRTILDRLVDLWELRCVEILGNIRFLPSDLKNYIDSCCLEEPDE